MPLVKKEQIGVKHATGYQYLDIDIIPESVAKNFN